MSMSKIELADDISQKGTSHALGSPGKSNDADKLHKLRPIDLPTTTTPLRRRISPLTRSITPRISRAGYTAAHILQNGIRLRSRSLRYLAAVFG